MKKIIRILTFIIFISVCTISSSSLRSLSQSFPDITVKRIPIEAAEARNIAYAGWDDFINGRWEVIEKYYQDLTSYNIEKATIKLAYIMYTKRTDEAIVQRCVKIHQDAYKKVLLFDPQLAQFFNYPLIDDTIKNNITTHEKILFDIWISNFSSERDFFHTCCFTKENSDYVPSSEEEGVLFKSYTKKEIQRSINYLVREVVWGNNKVENLVEKNVKLFKEAYEFCKENHPDQAQYFYTLELEEPDCTMHMFFLNTLQNVFKKNFLPVLFHESTF